jgi:hypothetical protein
MSCYEPSKATLEKLAKRQANKGIAPCGECNINRHNCCRPRLDGTLCTCSCARAEAARQRMGSNAGGDPARRQLGPILGGVHREAVPSAEECTFNYSRMRQGLLEPIERSPKSWRRFQIRFNWQGWSLR